MRSLLARRAGALLGAALAAPIGVASLGAQQPATTAAGVTPAAAASSLAGRDPVARADLAWDRGDFPAALQLSLIHI